ncbi:MAG: hypothetical protein OJF49_000249 [Ktedonobacterales bacterium]|jgi:hypothetical protein|nr:MAG: hypothetical protein OJF49_000249 [Ktedonobacterales bacterium]
MAESVAIGKIVRSESHVRYTCQVYSAGEIAAPPEPADYAFGSFVRMPLRISPGRADVALLDSPTSDTLPAPPAPRGRANTTHQDCWAIGLIYDTILVNPAFGSLGPRLSNDEQNELFAPDYISERAVLVSILLLGTLTPRTGGSPHVAHGVPPLALDLGAEVCALPDEVVRAFHHFADNAAPGGVRPYLHMGYLPHAIALDNPLLPMAMLRTIERLERLFPENRALLSIVKRNFAWKLKVQTAG